MSGTQHQSQPTGANRTRRRWWFFGLLLVAYIACLIVGLSTSTSEIRFLAVLASVGLTLLPHAGSTVSELRQIWRRRQTWFARRVIFAEPGYTLSTPESRRRRRGRANWKWMCVVLLLAVLLGEFAVRGGVNAYVGFIGFFGLYATMATMGIVRLCVATKRNRCPDCGYDLTGVPETPDATCPDCGAIDPHYDSDPHKYDWRRRHDPKPADTAEASSEAKRSP